MPMDATELISVRLRRATAADVPALVHLRVLMLDAMGVQTGGPDSAWRRAAELWFTERLRHPEEFAAFVVDDPELGVVSSAVGMCDRHAPSPANVSGVHGHVFNVSTDPQCRRLGHARACLDALLTWFRDETRVRVVNLNATQGGAGLYRALGFEAPRHPALQLRMTSGPSDQ
ncbi:N-acetyltransferase [Actinacidiphila oryziradicis]|jgi:ribosomal protein S18 acetylase RimI-like enzyme|uniref:GNAT family N-acetyltransferase n=1 Tax=Actinacidiphila oryziradicis TaxID=2571141 RepID=UPI0023F2C44E|nr:N-acetyltransferase [Actinacidiphila oryziradicis]MCW2870820.1 GCN5-related N-acetyltransferase [Actinacidiphila oryziradicis]